MSSEEETKKPFFSVICPTHNSEEFIRNALDSIAEQSFTDYELIVVCDACTDNTEAIAKEYTDKVYTCNYNRDGLTRNVGLDHATGEWILFIDDDDWFLHEYVFHMLHAVLMNTEADMLFFSFIWKYKGYIKQEHNCVFYAVWNKAWRRSYIGDTRFPDTKYISDKYFHEKVTQKPPKGIFWDMPMYYYNYLRKGSLSDELENERSNHEQTEATDNA